MVLCDDLGRAEVDVLDNAHMVEEDIYVTELVSISVKATTHVLTVGLDISMDDATRVQGFERGDLASALALKIEGETEENAQFQPRMS